MDSFTKILLLGYMVMSVICFMLMGIDKFRAVHGKWRISETALLVTAFFGGGAGGMLGMFLFHHKTRHWYFRLFLPVFTIAQVVLLIISTHAHI